MFRSKVSSIGERDELTGVRVLDRDGVDVPLGPRSRADHGVAPAGHHNLPGKRFPHASRTGPDLVKSSAKTFSAVSWT